MGFVISPSTWLKENPELQKPTCGNQKENEIAGQHVRCCQLSQFSTPYSHSPLPCHTHILVSASNRCVLYIHIHRRWASIVISQVWKHTTSSTVTLLPIDSKPFSLKPYHNLNTAQTHWKHNYCMRSTILHISLSQCTECIHTQIKGLWNTIHRLLNWLNANS